MATEVITVFGPGTGNNSVSGTAYITTWTSVGGANATTAGFNVPSNITDSATVNIVVRCACPGLSENGGYLTRVGNSGTATSEFYFCDSNGNNAVLIESISMTTASITSRNSPKTVNLRPLAGQRAYVKLIEKTSNPACRVRGDCRIKISYDTWSNCTAPTSVGLSRTRGTVTITWSGQAGGTNNAITGYTVIRNTSASTSGAATISSSASSGMTNAPGAGTFYYGVYSKSKYNTAGPKWSSAITVPSKPSVSAGTVITKAQMDTLKTWINGSQTTVTQYAVATAAHGNTYRSGLTAGTTAFDDAWYNAAANG